MTIIHVACGGVEHIGRVKGNSWKKAKKRQMIILKAAARVFHGQNEGRPTRVLMHLKDDGYGEGIVYIQVSSHYPCYIWIVEAGHDLYEVYMKDLKKDLASSLTLPPEKRIVPPGQQQTRKPPTPMGPRMKH